MNEGSLELWQHFEGYVLYAADSLQEDNFCVLQNLTRNLHYSDRLLMRTLGFLIPPHKFEREIPSFRYVHQLG